MMGRLLIPLALSVGAERRSRRELVWRFDFACYASAACPERVEGLNANGYVGAPLPRFALPQRVKSSTRTDVK